MAEGNNEATLPDDDSMEGAISEEHETSSTEIVTPNSNDDDVTTTETSSKRARFNFTQESKIPKKHSNKNESKCKICKQKLEGGNLKIYNGHPNEAVDEDTALIDERLLLFNGDEDGLVQNDMRAINKLTSFSIYCKNGHLCRLDSGLIEKEVYLYASGFVKPIYDDNPSTEGGVPCKDLGRIVEWFVTGFDGGSEAIVVLSTPISEYYLMKPSEEYASFMLPIREKTFLSKIVIEYLLDEPLAEYEDLLDKFESTPMPEGLPRFTEDMVINNAQFIHDQIISFDDSALPDEPLLVNAPCISSLRDLAGVVLKKGQKKGRRCKSMQGDEDWRGELRSFKQKKPSWTKATTTHQVHNIFENFFPEQLNNTTDKLSFKRKRCGVCEACLEVDCRECYACKDMIKYGGLGTGKQACVKRRCPNMQIAEGDEDKECSDSNDVTNETESNIDVYRRIMTSLKKKKSTITWVGPPTHTDKGDFYKSVMINDEEISKNDFIFIEPLDKSVAVQVIQVKYIWENKMGIKILHGTWLWRGNQTILGETALPRELFMVDVCQDVPLIYVQSKANVIVRQFQEDLNEIENIIDLLKEDSMMLFCQKRYEHTTARFEDLLSDIQPEEEQIKFCSTCLRDSMEKRNRIPQLFEKCEELSSVEEDEYGMVKYLDEEFRVSSAVFLKPGTFSFKYVSDNVLETNKSAPKREIVDEDKYPEHYRKFNDRIKGSNIDTPEPFEIGYITKIYSSKKSKLMASVNLYAKVKKMYRPENTHVRSAGKKYDLNMLYLGDKECDIRFDSIVGKCYVTYFENSDEQINEWSSMGPNRFYFTEAYDSDNEEFIEPPSRIFGKSSKGTKTKSKSKKAAWGDQPVNFPPITKKLRTLDVFSGCGGLSEGLKQAGIAESLWAIENDESAAHAYRLNNLNASVFTADCNVFLEKVMNGDESFNGLALPRKGEVDLLCGGPPCQGFSGMNRFNSRAYSSFKNSLVVSLISFCDFYKPRFFVMENVRNFVTFRKSEVLKLTLSCLVRMGYQCTFGVLQAGSFGIPQTRRRMILMAAAPGEILPHFPSPLHVFSKSTCQSAVEVDKVKYYTLPNYHDSAPFRVITVHDALSDLPEIKSGCSEPIMQYPNESTTHFQRKIRSNMKDDSLLFDHMCKDLGPLVEARMGYIPTKAGSDWRDLPNIIHRLSDGSYTDKLEYKYNDVKSGVSSTGAFRGVCRCAEGKQCHSQDKQVNTLIPWCLPHTANRHNHWAGLYGRIEWDGFFSTTITNPEPMGKQGRVLHPEQTRVVSVRECARSQGFPDSFRFYGNIQEKHRQIGNAVPPPLAMAIGHEIRKSVSLREAKKQHV